MKNIFINRNIFLICIGGFISSIGDNLYNIGLTLSMYSMSGSVTAVAGMWLVRALIRIPGQFFSGIIVDKYNRKKIMVYVNFFSGIICMLLIFVNSSNYFLAYIIIFILQATSDLDNSSGMAMIPEIVEKKDLGAVNSIFSLVSTITLFIAPAIGGLVYIKYGVSILYILNSLSFIFGGIMYAMIDYRPEVADNTQKEHKFMLIQFAKEGYKTVLQKKAVLIIIISTSTFAILGRLYEIYKIYIAEQIFSIGSVGIVYFSYAMAVGSLMAPFIIKSITKNEKNSFNYLVITSILTGVGFMIFGISQKSILLCFAVLIIGVFQTCMTVLINTIIQKEIENQYLGRVFSFYKIVTMISAIFGILIASPMLEFIGTKTTLLIFSSIGILSVLIAYIVNQNLGSRHNYKQENAKYLNSNKAEN